MKFILDQIIVIDNIIYYFINKFYYLYYLYLNKYFIIDLNVILII